MHELNGPRSSQSLYLFTREKNTMRLQRNTSFSLCQLHKQLNLSQSSLASSIGNLPDQMHFTGIVTHYEELQFVGWQKEVIITICEGCIETLRISMWLNQENPIGLQISSPSEIIGKLIHIKNVHITGFDFSNSTELQFNGEVRASFLKRSVMLILVASGGSLARFAHRAKPLAVNYLISSIPKRLQAKNSTMQYPLLPEDHSVLQKPLLSLKTYHYCIAQRITFGSPLNPFQEFINIMQLQDDEDLSRSRRYSQRWVRSYEQQNEWELKQKCKRMEIIN